MSEILGTRKNFDFNKRLSKPEFASEFFCLNLDNFRIDTQGQVILGPNPDGSIQDNELGSLADAGKSFLSARRNLIPCSLKLMIGETIQLYDKIRADYGRVTLVTLNQCSIDQASLSDVMCLSDEESSFGETICVW